MALLFYRDPADGTFKPVVSSSLAPAQDVAVGAAAPGGLETLWADVTQSGQTLDERYVNLTGDAMTGNLAYNQGQGAAWPIADRAVTVRSGETDLAITQNDRTTLAPLVAADPVLDTHAATKAYVDSNRVESDTVSLDAKWAAYGGAFGTTVRLLKQDGWVWIEGLIKTAAPPIAASGGTEILIGTIPRNFWPIRLRTFATLTTAGTTGPYYSRVDVSPSGDVSWIPTKDASFAGGWITLTGFSWMAARP